MLTRLHVRLAEWYGGRIAKMAYKCAKHALKVNDQVTYQRCLVLTEFATHDLGWNEDSFDGGRVIPNRDKLHAHSDGTTRLYEEDEPHLRVVPQHPRTRHDEAT